MAGSAVGAVLFVWAIGALLGGSDVPSVKGAANVRADGVPLASAVPSSNPPPTGRLLLGSGSSSSASASASAAAARPGAPVVSVSGTPVVPAGPLARSGSVSASVTATPTTTTPPPAAPKACPDSVMNVTATAAAPVYNVGDKPVLTLHISNFGPVACVRDISHQLRSIEILSAGGKARIWASSDCYTVDTNEVRTFKPNQTYAYSVAWAGRTSGPGCPSARTTVPAGTYEVVGKLGKLVGAPTPLTLKP